MSVRPIIRLRAETSWSPSHLGPAVNKKPAKNSGINPIVMTKAWAEEIGTAHGDSILSARVANMMPHHTEVSTSMIAARKNARRCGAASSQFGLQGGGNALPLFESAPTILAACLTGIVFTCLSAHPCGVFFGEACCLRRTCHHSITQTCTREIVSQSLVNDGQNKHATERPTL